MSTAKKFAGQTAVYGITTIAGRTLSFFLTYIYTRAYPTHIYSVFATMFAWASMLNSLLAFGMETTFFRYLNKRSDSKNLVFNNSFGVIFMITVLFLTCTVPFIPQISQWIRVDQSTSSGDYERYVKYFLIILVTDAWCVIPFAKLRAEGRPGRFGILKLTNILVFIGLNLAFIYVIPYLVRNQLPGSHWIQTWFRQGWLGYVFLSNVIASCITLLMLAPEILKLRPRFDPAMIKEMLLYSWPVLIANFSFIINENLDKILIGKLLPPSISSSELGIYSGCAKIAIFLNLFVQAFRLGAEPFFFNYAKNANAGNTYAKIMNYFVIIMSVIYVGLVANIEILKHFISDDYWSGLGVVPLLLFGYVSLGVYMNLSIWYKLSDQTRYGLYISATGAIITVVLNVILIPHYSYMAAAWVSLIAYSSMMVLSYLWGQKNYPIPYNLKKNLVYILASALTVYLSFSVFKRNIFAGNTLLIVFISVTLYFEKKEITAILKK